MLQFDAMCFILLSDCIDNLRCQLLLTFPVNPEMETRESSRKPQPSKTLSRRAEYDLEDSLSGRLGLTVVGHRGHI